MSDTLTTEMAYLAMCAFVGNYAVQTQSVSVSTLAGELSVINLKRPVDIALWHSWLENVAKAKSGEVDAYAVINGVRQRLPSA